MSYKEKKHYGEYIPAYDESIEKAVIGAMLIERQAAPIAIPLLRPEMFYYKKHETIFKAFNYKFRVTATFSVCLIQIYLNVISHDKFQETCQ